MEKLWEYGADFIVAGAYGHARLREWVFGDAGVIMGLGELVFCTSVLAFGAYRLGFDINALRTLAFVVIVFGNQATMYTNRERRHLWSSHPSFWVVFSSIADLLIASTLAVGGILMTPLPASIVAGTLAAAAVFAVLLMAPSFPAVERAIPRTSARTRCTTEFTAASRRGNSGSST